jgi:uncharacterized protein YggE
MSRLLFTSMIPFVMSLALPAVLAQDIHVGADTRWIIESVGTATASPNVIHLMMKMEYQAAQAADATARGEKQLAEFLAAVEALTIPNLTYRACNTVFTSGQASQGALSGFVYTRNVVFTIRRPQPGPSSGGLERTIAQLEDLGARYNSHCVTCVGSG